MSISGVFLIYSALFVPMQLSFWMDSETCTVFVTTYFDLVVDTYFLVRAIMSSGSCATMRYVCSPGLFLFDLATSIPFSYYDIYIFTLKPLRILKLLRILKTMRFVARLEDELSYWLGPVVVKMSRLVLNLMVSTHLCCCAYWRVKTDSAPDDLEAFLNSKSVDGSNVSDVYVMCFYFVFTVFATVGFGDIYAVNMSERIFCIFLFLAGSSLFGTMISQLNEIVQTVTRQSREMDDHMMGFRTFMSIYSVPRQVESTISQWVRFQFTEDQADRQKRGVLSDPTLPEEHRLALARSLRHDLFFQIPFLINIPDRVRSMFSAELLLRAESRYYSQETVIGDFCDHSNSLMIIAKGYVEMCLPTRDGGKVLRLLKRGDLFGDSHIVGDYRWAGAWGIEADFVAKSMCSIISIRASDIRRILKRFDFTVIRRRVERGTYFWKLWQEEEVERLAREPLRGGVAQHDMKPKIVCLWIDAARRLLHSVDAVKPSPLAVPLPRRASTTG